MPEGKALTGRRVVVTKNLLSFGALLGAFLVFVPRAWPMSYVPMNDGALADAADVVVIGEVVAHEPMPGQPLDAQRYRLRIDSVLKGQLSAGEIAVRQPGSMNPDLPGALTVPGAVK